MGSPNNIALEPSYRIRPLKASKYDFYAKTPPNMKISQGWKTPQMDLKIHFWPLFTHSGGLRLSGAHQNGATFLSYEFWAQKNEFGGGLDPQNPIFDPQIDPKCQYVNTPNGT